MFLQQGPLLGPASKHGKRSLLRDFQFGALLGGEIKDILKRYQPGRKTVTIQLSDRSQLVKPSATLSLNTKAAEMKGQGIDVINLTAGEPDFDTPSPIKKACSAAMDEGKTGYSAVSGAVELRQAICDKLQRDNQLQYGPNDIIVSNGAKQTLYNLAQAMLNPGDEAIIPAPYWVSYPSMVAMTGADSVFIETSLEDQFKITAEQLQQAITPKSRLFFLNSPSNPSGMVYSKQELGELADVLLAHPQIAVASDDIYEKLFWNDEEFTHILNVCPELKEQTVVINGCSKAYAMTGWRIGYSAAPAGITGAMKKIQSHSTSGPNTMAQYAAIEALAMTDKELEPMFTAYRSRLKLAQELLCAIPGVECLPAQGAFYLYPRVQGLMEKLGIQSDTELSDLLLTKHHLATVPGTAFGTNGYLRLSCACDEDILRKGIDRIRQCVG
jgi:aspartate aminotransferase